MIVLKGEETKANDTELAYSSDKGEPYANKNSPLSSKEASPNGIGSISNGNSVSRIAKSVKGS